MNRSVEPLTPAAFASFGSIIEQPTRATDASGAGWRWWGELTQLEGGDRPYALGYLDLQPAPLSFDWAERHLHSDELIVPLGGECLVYVAPPDVFDEPEQRLPPEAFRVFRLGAGQAALLTPGVWHGAPLAISQPLKVLVILLHNTGKQDTQIVRFAPLEITL
jgi:ureidoglycolate lyase